MVLLALAKFAEPVDIAVLQFSDESHPAFQQERERLARALRHAWQRNEPETAARRRQKPEAVRRYRPRRSGATMRNSSATHRDG